MERHALPGLLGKDAGYGGNGHRDLARHAIETRGKLD
jgi:hypothetical protein